MSSNRYLIKTKESIEINFSNSDMSAYFNISYNEINENEKELTFKQKEPNENYFKFYLLTSNLELESNDIKKVEKIIYEKKYDAFLIESNKVSKIKVIKNIVTYLELKTGYIKEKEDIIKLLYIK